MNKFCSHFFSLTMYVVIEYCNCFGNERRPPVRSLINGSRGPCCVFVWECCNIDVFSLPSFPSLVVPGAPWWSLLVVLCVYCAAVFLCLLARSWCPPVEPSPSHPGVCLSDHPPLQPRPPSPLPPPAQLTPRIIPRASTATTVQVFTTFLSISIFQF